MTYLTGSIILPNTHRLYEPLNNILVLTTCFCISFHTIRSGVPKYEREHAQTYFAKQFPRRIYLPLYGIFETALEGLKPSQLEIVFKEESDPDEPGIVPGSFLTLLSNIICPTFVQFFEDHREWLEGQLPLGNWPSVLSFGRVIRNAIAHGGKCDIRGKRGRPVKWHHLTYSTAENGHQIINHDLTFADLLILMFEMSDALDEIGCPRP